MQNMYIHWILMDTSDISRNVRFWNWTKESGDLVYSDNIRNGQINKAKDKKDLGVIFQNYSSAKHTDEYN